MSSKRKIRQLAKVVREELRFMQDAMQRQDWEWVQTHAQQAAGLAATLEMHTIEYCDQQNKEIS
jgi:hypothetical protein